ncbi:hypothetical protein GCM10022415_24050 [Knoellia locipacati]|uniref:Zinc-finger domain-containing protein n=1 Tax=Knoellia locipacati TaxID=882824 RepID=A0A512T2G2_9MICO|nr:zf-HC2 domain-containing protein [Knoellia locipacati]GEQ14354.1 hypothetical protein KLO01_24010 [Knoellia locipacati]
MATTDHRPEDSPDHGFPLADHVEGLLDRARRHEVEDHLRGCATCSAEVALARLGREAGRREHAAALADDEGSAALHERLMAGLPDAARSRSGEPVDTRPAGRVGRRALLLGVAAGTLVVAGVAVESVRRTRDGSTVDADAPAPSPTAGGGEGGTGSTSTDPAAVLDAAMADYRVGRLPSGRQPTAAPPDLAGLGLSVEGASTATLAEQTVSVFGYRTGEGERVVVYVGERPFTSPALQGAQYAPRAVQDMWAAWFPRPTPTLVLGEDERLVHDVCEALV